MTDLITSDGETIATGCMWNEGPVWLPERGVVRWSDIPANRICEVDPETREFRVYAENVEFTNGRTLNLEGRVVQCSHGNRRVERDTDGTVETIVDHFGDARLNSPNDVIVDSRGRIWFTDPPYGITEPEEGHPGEREYGGCFVFRFDEKSGELTPVITDMVEPNGLAFSPDERTLYVADTSWVSTPDGSGNHHIRAYPVNDDGVADGFRIDAEGRIWTSAGTRVEVYTPEGEMLERVDLGKKVGNLCFGGPDGSDLFVAASTDIARFRTSTRDTAHARRSAGALDAPIASNATDHKPRP